MPLHPDMQLFLDQLAAAGMPPDFPAIGAAAARALGAERPMPGQGPELERVANIIVPTRDGKVPGRLYAPANPTGLLIYLHGGGWVLGTLDGYDPPLRRLAERSGWAILSVDYRLAPEHPFPAAVEDCFDAAKWAAGNLAALGLEEGFRIAIGGDSAGGNLAAVTALLARDESGPRLAAQLLIYPVTDSDFASASYIEHAQQSPLSGSAMRWFWDQYLPEPDDRTNPRASPLRTIDLSGLPPALIILAGYDPLLTEGERYGAALRDAGVAVQVLRYDGLTHGFFQFAELLPIAGEALGEIAAAFRRFPPETG